MTDTVNLESPRGWFFYTSPRGEPKLLLPDASALLTQADMADLFGVNRSVIADCLSDLYESGELDQQATPTGAGLAPQATHPCQLAHSLGTAMTVGLRVNSPQAAQFRQWAAEILRSLLLKGFALDHERLKQGSDACLQEYFDHLLEGIRETRISQRNFCQRFTDIYALSQDYREDAPTTKIFYAVVRDKLSWVMTREVNHPLSDETVKALDLLISTYLNLAENQARRGSPMKMGDWAQILEELLEVIKEPEMLTPESVDVLTARIQAAREQSR